LVNINKNLNGKYIITILYISDLNFKLFNFFESCINEHLAMFTYFDTTFSESEKKLLNKILIKCYNEQQQTLGLDTINIGSILPEERIKDKIIIKNPNLETYPYKNLKYYFETIINLYRDKYHNEPIDEYLKKTLFCGLLNDDNLPNVNYIKGGKYIKRKSKRVKRKSKYTKKRRFKYPKV
jgi:hypothetical protein